VLALRRSWPLWTGAIGQGTRWTRRRLRFLAAAVHIVKLVSVVPVPAFTAIELIPLPISGINYIVAVPAVEHILAAAAARLTPAIQSVGTRPTVEDVAA
jgi:hypothetical protein